LRRKAKNAKRPLAEISTTGVNWCANFVRRESKSSPKATLFELAQKVLLSKSREKPSHYEAYEKRPLRCALRRVVRRAGRFERLLPLCC